MYGSIRVLAGARLFSFDNQVCGNIVGEGAASTRSVRNMVHGNFVVRGGGPAPVGPTALLCGTTLGGSAVIEGTTGGIGVRYSPVPGLDPPTAPHCEANWIGGNLVARGNTMTRPLVILGNEIGGNAVVTNNTGSGAKTVSGNRRRKPCLYRKHPSIRRLRQLGGAADRSVHRLTAGRHTIELQAECGSVGGGQEPALSPSAAVRCWLCSSDRSSTRRDEPTPHHSSLGGGGSRR